MSPAHSDQMSSDDEKMVIKFYKNIYEYNQSIILLKIINLGI